MRWSIIFALTEYAGLWGDRGPWVANLPRRLAVAFGTASFWGDFDFLYQLILVMVKSSFLILTMMWISASFPRLRIDQLMSFCWKSCFRSASFK